MEKKIRFSIANNSVTHLGRNLYNTMPPALAELIANSYDAYAKNVDIVIDKEQRKIIIADDGLGMDAESLQNKYALIGKPKQPENPPEDMSERKPMGKKGIGKLAAFSLGNNYTIYTKTKKSGNWITFGLGYNDLKGSTDSEYEAEYQFVEQLPQDLQKYRSHQQGFVIVIDELRANPTQSTEDNLIKQLSRRFYIERTKSNFSLTMNDKKVDLSQNAYYDNLEYIEYFGYTKDEIEKIFPQSGLKKKSYLNQEDNLWLDSKQIKGWIGTVDKPKSLKSDKGSFLNIIVYVNGKIADEDILKNRSDSRIASQYIVGEVKADFLSDELEDPITSSRQGLDDSIPLIQEFISKIENIRNDVILNWDKIREDKILKKLPKTIGENPKYKQWTQSLTPKQQKTHKTLMKMMLPSIDQEEYEIEALKKVIVSIVGTINNMNFIEVSREIESSRDDLPKYISLIGQLLDKISNEESISHFSIIKSRLQAIEELERLMDDQEALEKLFEKHLSENPWLINPYWNKNTSALDIKEQAYYKEIKKDGEGKRNFIDILIQVAEEPYPVIIELKKNTPTGHAKVKFEDIYSQIKAYRKAIKSNYPSWGEIAEEEIPAYFIISEKSGVQGSGNVIEFSKNELELLSHANIKVLKYNEIVKNAKLLYLEHLNLLRKKPEILSFDFDE